MNIVCPHCTTFFAIDPAKLGPAGRSVRCARCKQVWLAQPTHDDVHGEILKPVLASASASGGTADDADRDALEWNEAGASESLSNADTPVIDSPSIATDWPAVSHDGLAAGDDATNSNDGHDVPGSPPPRQPWLRSRSRRRRTPRKPLLTPSMICVGMAAMVAALIVWRTDVVRLLPQTAQFYRLIGLEVNLRGLAFKDVKVTSETVDNKPVLVIEGNIVDVGRKPANLPRLRFIVRDAKGTEIYAWNAVLEQPTLKPGEQAWFRSRLATPPPEGRNIEVRFFNRHDLATGGV